MTMPLSERLPQSVQSLFRNKIYLGAEFFVLCLVIPTIIITLRLAPFMFAFLWGAALYSLFMLRYVHHVRWRQMWKWDAVTWAALRPILIRWIFACAAMAAICLWYDPAKFLRIPLEKPHFAVILCFVYPLLSALPQEIIFCTFFFRRYEGYFGRGLLMVIVSAVVFAYAHVLYINWVAPLLSLVAGLIFAETFRKTRSLAVVTIEHGLYGNALFLIGLGWYFYGGAVALQHGG